MTSLVVPVVDDDGDVTVVLVVDTATWSYQELWSPGAPPRPGLATRTARSVEAVLEVAIGNSITVYPGTPEEVEQQDEALARADELLMGDRPGVGYLEVEDVQRLSDIRVAVDEVRDRLDRFAQLSIRAVEAAAAQLAADLDRVGSQLDELGYRPPPRRLESTGRTEVAANETAPPTPAAEPDDELLPVESLKVAKVFQVSLRNAGYHTVQDVDRAPRRDLQKIQGLGPARVRKVKEAAAVALGKAPPAPKAPSKPASKPEPRPWFERDVEGVVVGIDDEDHSATIQLADGRQYRLSVLDVPENDWPEIGNAYTVDIEHDRVAYPPGTSAVKGRPHLETAADVVGMRLDRAREVLQSAGFRVDAQTFSGRPFRDESDWTVTNQFPSGGRYKPGEVFDLSVEN